MDSNNVTYKVSWKNCNVSYVEQIKKK